MAQPLRRQDATADKSPAAMLAYRHTLEIEVAAAWVERHFTAAVERCVQPACVVLNSQIDQSPGRLRPPSASLIARLPHAALPAFRDAAVAALPDEPASSVGIRAQSTQAEDLGRVIEDSARRLQQLTAYRERLTALAARTDIQVTDLIKVAETLSQTQSEIEAAAAQQRGLAERVDTEIITIRFNGATAADGTWTPVRTVWARAGEVLSTATAQMLYVVLSVVPWVPAGAAAVAVVWFGLRRWRRY